MLMLTMPRRWAKTARGFALALLLCGGAVTTLSACSGLPGVSQQATTPRLQVLDLQTKYEPVQIAIETAVTTPGLPATVKKVLQTVDATATASLDAYTEAVIRGDSNLNAYVNSAFAAISNAIAATARFGFIKEGAF